MCVKSLMKIEKSVSEVELYLVLFSTVMYINNKIILFGLKILLLFTLCYWLFFHQSKNVLEERHLKFIEEVKGPLEVGSMMMYHELQERASFLAIL